MCGVRTCRSRRSHSRSYFIHLAFVLFVPPSTRPLHSRPSVHTSLAALSTPSLTRLPVPSLAPHPSFPFPFSVSLTFPFPLPFSRVFARLPLPSFVPVLSFVFTFVLVFVCVSLFPVSVVSLPVPKVAVYARTLTSTRLLVFRYQVIVSEGETQSSSGSAGGRRYSVLRDLRLGVKRGTRREGIVTRFRALYASMEVSISRHCGGQTHLLLNDPIATPPASHAFMSYGICNDCRI